ncbi:MAG: sulfatase-like hydrolase/transferase [Planctomycetaceae bacterium]
MRCIQTHALTAAAVLCAVSAAADETVAPTTTRQPNILVILADDAGWGDFSINGNRTVSTPAIDSLARDGCLLETFLVQPVCAPTRAEFLTGRYHPRGGVRGVTLGEERLAPTERTIAQVLKDSGYATGCFGKWHNGTQWPYHPLARGFDQFYGFTEGHWGGYFDAEMEDNGQFVTGRGYITDDITDHAISFLDSAGSPFFCYVPFNTPHTPMSVPTEDWDRYGDRAIAQTEDREVVDFTRAALAMVENLDRNVGRLLAALDHRGIADDTIVVFFSDNGANSPRWCGGMRGRKGTTDEGGVRSVCCIRWPSRIGSGRRIAAPTGAIDLLPTLAACAAAPTTGCLPLDGVDLSPLITGSYDATAVQQTIAERAIISSFNGKVSVRTATHRLDAAGRLYDMTADPCQSTEISGQRPEEALRLEGIAAEWRRDVLAAGPRPDVERFPVGHAAAPHTELPARDGNPHGGITRSSRAPNCSFFTTWTSVDDSITRTVDVLTPGDYVAELWYTCAAENVGSTIELCCEPSTTTQNATTQPRGTDAAGSASRGRTSITRSIAEPFDPPLNLGEDRVERQGESLVKPFKPLPLGTLSLTAGPATLSLRATTIPGAGVADVRRLVLRPARH